MISKNSITVSLLFFVLFNGIGYSQAVTDVKLSLMESEYGNTRLKVTPLVTDMYAEKPTKSSGVYALLVCYKYKGEQKALHQDLTGDFAKQGYREVFLGMQATRSNVDIGNYVFYRRDLTPEGERPKKADCFK
ncbi:hypothetical protein ACFQ1Q_03145 [Winogradskyella litorisediminis]|uniref:Uncharacterized protein n=1 Tax=Winogradskyella litorisediminis TaxID=1156618 RepID=A0ABW3N3D9_9FLAO